MAKIFQPASGDPWRKNAVIGGHFAEAGSYEFTFAEAAKHLGETALSTGLLDFYFYPMCFLFRHAFELTLKSLTLQTETFLTNLNKLGETNVPTDAAALAEKLRTHEKAHSLHWLMNHLERRLAQIPGCEPIPAGIRAALIELHNIDPSGETFRYSIDRRGRLTLPKTALVDVERVCRELSEAHELLFYGLGTWLYENRESAEELLGELSAEMEAPDW